MANLREGGGSSGLGLGLSELLASSADRLWVVSRNEPQFGDQSVQTKATWIQADLLDNSHAGRIAAAIGENALDALIYCAGIWEENGFEQTNPEEIDRILKVNVGPFLSLGLALTPQLRQSDRAKVIAIGSTAGLDNLSGARAAYAASKFALRGAVHALK